MKLIISFLYKKLHINDRYFDLLYKLESQNVNIIKYIRIVFIVLGVNNFTKQSDNGSQSPSK